MEEQIQPTTSPDQSIGKGKGMTWLWVVIAVIVLIVLFMWFRKPAGDNTGKPGEVMEKETPQPTTAPPLADDISGLDVGGNPDVGVDDFNTLPASQEPIN